MLSNHPLRFAQMLGDIQHHLALPTAHFFMSSIPKVEPLSSPPCIQNVQSMFLVDESQQFVFHNNPNPSQNAYDIYITIYYNMIPYFISAWIPYQSLTQMLPSGKRLHNYGKSPCVYGKTHYFYGNFQ